MTTTVHPSSGKQATRNTRARRRLRHHLVLALVSAILMVLVYALVRPDAMTVRLSMATAYASFALLGATLLMGPLKVLLGRPNPIHADLRRDVGIWAAIIALAHIGFALQHHAGGRVLYYFLEPLWERGRFPLRLDPFGIANHLGLVATVILILLLALSNDLALRALRPNRWKALQRLNYGLWGMVALHALAYQLIEEQRLLFLGVLIVTVGSVVFVQLAGVRSRRKRAKPGR